MSVGQASPEQDDFADEQPFRVLAIVNTLLRGRWIIVGVAGVVTSIAIVMSLLAQPVFTSTAKFLPSQSPAMSSRMGAIIEGGASSLGRSDDPSTDYYVALVQSPSFLQGVVVRTFNTGTSEPQTLVDYYKVPGSSESERVLQAADKLGKAVSVSAPRAIGSQPRIITLECDAASATLAADVCSAILAEITKHNIEVRGAKARQNREFVQSQLDAAKKELEQATQAFAAFTARNRKIVSPALDAERDRLERQVKVKDDVYNTLSRQLVLARIEEQETRPSIELVERPLPPLLRSAPRRTRTVLMAGFTGLVLGCGIALLLDRARRLSAADPDSVELRSELAKLRLEILRPLGARR